MPGFHPWNEDDRYLIKRYEAEAARERKARKRRSAGPPPEFQHKGGMRERRAMATVADVHQDRIAALDWDRSMSTDRAGGAPPPGAADRQTNAWPGGRLSTKDEQLYRSWVERGAARLRQERISLPAIRLPPLVQQLRLRPLAGLANRWSGRRARAGSRPLTQDIRQCRACGRPADAAVRATCGRL